MAVVGDSTMISLYDSIAEVLEIAGPSTEEQIGNKLITVGPT